MNGQPFTIHHTIGIAGHIDHGKTTLTRAMTGVDTDRLKEEKERNISIEPGFAPCNLPNGETVGVVDVPGHERFIRQMISGAAGIDLVVLVIAADEGVMPQTKEHTDILGFLGIQKGIIALTRTDLVDPEWLAMVTEEVGEWAKDTFLSDAPIIPVSGKTGQGVDLLLQTIAELLQDIPSRRHRAPFRMPIDRAFTIKGAGTVVTGTVYEGTVTEEDRLELLPAQTEVRIRRIQVHHQPAAKASAGQRTALNIAGVNLEQVARGMALVAPGYFQNTNRLDVRFFFLKHLDFSLKQRVKVRLHMGTSEVDGTLVFFDRNSLQPGEEVFAQLHLEEPIIAKKGDPFILRRPTPATTLGGGRILNPYAQSHRFGIQTIEDLMKLSGGDPTEQILHYIIEKEYATLEEITQHFAISKEEFHNIIEELQQSGEVVSFDGEISRQGAGGTLVSGKALTRWLETINLELQKYHNQYPLRAGMGKALLKSGHFKSLPDRLWRQILTAGVDNNLIIEEGEAIQLTEFNPHLPEKNRAHYLQVIQDLEQAGLTPPSWTALMKKHKIPENTSGDFKAYLLQQNQILSLTDDLYIIRKEWETGVQKLREATQQEPLITPALAREVLGLSRKYLIPFLESLDAQHLTRRTEEGRVWIID